MKYLVLLMLVAGCSENSLNKSPRFKAGDCVCEDLNAGYEFSEPNLWCKQILKVGKNTYLLNERNGEHPFDYVETDGVYLVNCKEMGL